MTRIINYLLAAGVLLALAAGAEGATLSLTPGATSGSPLTGTIPGAIAPNDFVGTGNLFDPLTSIAGYFGATINYNVSGTGSITLDFFGGEAGFHDQFFYNSGSGMALVPGFDHPGSPSPTRDVATTFVPKATFTTALSGSGVVPFEFVVNGAAGGSSGGPINGLNPLNTPGLPPDFFVACAPVVASGVTPTSCSTMWVFLDDNGASNDDDYDDLAVRITVSDGSIPAPEPSTLALLGSGILGLGLVGSRLKR